MDEKRIEIRLPKVGKAYRRIAERFVEDVDKEQFDSVLRAGRLRKIEAYVSVVGPLQKITHDIARKMVVDGVDVPCNLFWTVLFSETPKKDLAGFRNSLLEKNYSERKRLYYAMLILKTAHDEWVKSHGKEFFLSHMVKHRHRYLDFELIGFNEAMRYYSFVEILFGLMGWKIDKKDLLVAYHRMQEAFTERNNLNGVDDIVSYVMGGSYKSLTPEIAHIYRTDRRLVERIVFS